MKVSPAAAPRRAIDPAGRGLRAPARPAARPAASPAARLSVRIACLLAAMLPALPAAAQDVWVGGGSNDWFTNGNWQDGSAPTTGDSVQIETRTPNATVINGGTANAADLRIGVTGSGSLTVNGTGDLNVGAVTVGSGGSFTVDNGSDLEIGSLSGGGAVTIGAGAQLGITGSAATTFSGSIGGDGDFSYDGGGTLTLTGDSDIGGALTMCSCAGGTLIVDGGSFSSTGDTYIAGSTLELRDGARLTADFLTLDFADMIVTGAGTRVTTGSVMSVGYINDSTLLIADGGRVVSLSAVNIDSLSGEGYAEVTGAGSRWEIAGQLFVGDGTFGGFGDLLITEGGVVDVEQQLLIGPGSTLYLGNGDGTGEVEALEIGNDGEIIAFFSDDLTIDTDISGDGGLIKDGGGTLTLSGVNTYRDYTLVYDGGLVVDGPLLSRVFVDSDGTLGGSGALFDGLVTFGTIAPGNSIGTLTVVGDAVFLPGSVLEVEVAPDGSDSDRLHVIDEAELYGGTVRHVGLTGGYVDSATHTILTADGGVRGRFDAVESDFAFLDPSLSYDANNVYLTLERNDVGFDEIADTGNQTTTAGGVASLPADSKVARSVVTLSNDQALEAYDALSGELHANVSGTLLEDSRLLREIPFGRLRQAFAAQRGPGQQARLQYALAGASDLQSLPLDREVTAWSQAFGAWGRRDGAEGVAAVDHWVGGLLLGADMPVFDGWRLGLFTGYDRRSLRVEERRSSAEVDSLHLGTYAGTELGALGIALGASYSRHAVSSERDVVFAGFGEAIESDYTASTLQLFGEASLDLPLGPLALQPFAAVAATRSDSAGFEESGGEAALAVEANDHLVTYATLGLRGAAGLEDLGLPAVTGFGSLAWRHAFGELSPDGTATLNGGAPFTIQGLAVARDTALLELGLAAPLGEAGRLELSYAGQLGDGYREHGLSLGLSLRF